MDQEIREGMKLMGRSHNSKEKRKERNKEGRKERRKERRKPVAQRQEMVIGALALLSGLFMVSF